MRYSGGGIALFKKIDGKTFVLLGKRKYKPFPGCWTFPGGGAEHGETLLQAGLREFREETGVRLDEASMTECGSFKIDVFWFRWQTTMIETTQNITPTPCHEFTEMQWIAVSEIKNYRLHPFVKTVVRRYERKRQRGRFAH